MFSHLEVNIKRNQKKTNDANADEYIHVLPAKFVSQFVIWDPWCKYQHEVCINVDYKQVKPFLVIQHWISHWKEIIMKFHLKDAPEEEATNARKNIIIKQTCSDAKTESCSTKHRDPKEH